MNIDTLIFLIGTLKDLPFVEEILNCIKYNSGENRTFLFWKIIQQNYKLPVNFYFLEFFFRTIGIDAYFTVIKRTFLNSEIISIFGKSEYETIVHLGYGKQPFENPEKYFKNLEYLKISGVLVIHGKL